MITNQKRIILAEDNPTAARLIEIALKRTGIPHDLEVVTDGDQAIEILSREVPDLLLLDLYMPGKNGFEVLEHMKRQKHLRRAPVVMLSSTDSAADINRAYDLHVNAFVRKHFDFADLSRAVDSIADFWLRTAETASDHRP
jgi:CheY-like chemotaxis protein